MTNQEISHLLRTIAASYAIKDEKKHYFQIIAYQKAADAIEKTTTEAKDLYKEDKLATLPGVGPSIQAHLSELFRTGKVKHFETVLKEVPPAVFPLLDIPSFGPKKAFKLVSVFKFTNPKTVIDDLAKIAESGKIADLEGFGEKSQADILRAVQEYRLGKTKSGRMVLPYANELAEKMLTYLRKSKYVKDAYAMGSLRRRRDTIGDVDLAVTSGKLDEVIKHFVAYPYKDRVIEKGPQTSSIIISGGKQIDIMVLKPELAGSLLQHFTGSKAHNIKLRELALKKGWSLSEKGIKQTYQGKKVMKTYDTEEKFYKALSMDWIPPEIREDTGEIERALKHDLPPLIELKDIKGDFHLHSNFPIEPSHDLGADTIKTMVDTAKQRGYSYMGFSEHNPSTGNHTAQQIYTLTQKRNNEIEKVQKSNKSIRIFKLLETDIQPSGDLAIDEKALSLLDAAIVSIHSVFSMPKEQMTKRIIKGLSRPKAKILAHPTGRIINERSGYEVDWEELFAFAKSHKKALEINAWPTRLDLPDEIVRKAVEKGVLLIIDTDSHTASQMDLMQYGVSVARRGWATKANIVNSWPLDTFTSWLLNRE
ncbi:MAG: DNA polymerase/3'-5' exonuclease PolX [Candidatus Levybacteria bacterium]|nr:DNA polymerase/3'-5' exonuclease PolX [Candidatus Levybacteria bacterium]